MVCESLLRQVLGLRVIDKIDLLYEEFGHDFRHKGGRRLVFGGFGGSLFHASGEIDELYWLRGHESVNIEPAHIERLPAECRSGVVSISELRVS